MFVREDWTLFRTLTTLGQRAGVPLEHLPALVAKELADNALDAAGSCRVGLLDGNGLWVEDDGDGIPGDDDQVAALFSVGRPLTSSKLLRLPTRGALGNGLRVVAGAVLASGGELVVETRGRALRLTPQHETGETIAERLAAADRPGTRVEVRLGPTLEVGAEALRWAERAVLLNQGKPYAGKTSPHWYDSDSFYELTKAAGNRTVRELMLLFDGCGREKATEIAGGLLGKPARELDRAEAERLLGRARAVARPVSHARLGCVGTWVDGFPLYYHASQGWVELPAALGAHAARLPVIVEAWAEAVDGEPEVSAAVNRTPITAALEMVQGPDRRLSLHGCNLTHYLTAEKSRRALRLMLNVVTPFMPITSDGKAPDLLPMLGLIKEAAGKAGRKARQRAAVPRSERPEEIKGVILGRLAEAADKASGGGAYRFSLRQLFYAVRPHVLEAVGREPDYDYFARVVTEHEADAGEIPGMYRDPRGTLYHPHTGEEIPLGTLSVEQYSRPAWTFNKVLYCEKEGFFPILRAARWPERHDCALMTSKGYASRAARDLLDLLGESAEELHVFCIHDGDAYGSMIYQALQEGTRARPGRRVHVHNLGLEPAEALAMGLQVEDVQRGNGRAAPVADYVAPEWAEWLQAHRVELNAMTTPQFLEWLDGKLAGLDLGKVIPPAEVLGARLEAEVHRELEAGLRSRILREGGLARRLEAAVESLAPVVRAEAETIRGKVERHLGENPADLWEQPVRDRARMLAG